MPILPPSVDSDAIVTRARSYADVFTLPLRDSNWRGNPGEYAGLGVGSSLDFQDHRNYFPGDDPRHINWQAYARTGDYTLKLFREEVRPVVEIVFDVSGSMFAVPEKATRALELFTFCQAAAEKSGAASQLYLVKGDHAKLIETHSLVSGICSVISLQWPETRE